MSIVDFIAVVSLSLIHILHTFPQRDLLTDCSRQLQTCPQAATAR